jgi:hypothetical protein
LRQPAQPFTRSTPMATAVRTFDDIAAYHPTSGTVLQLLGRGDGSFTIVPAMVVMNRQLSIADLNGDGITDGFVYDSTSGAFILAISSGDGHYGPFELSVPTGLTLLLQGGFTP